MHDGLTRQLERRRCLSLARDVDLAARDIFEFQGSNCDALVASVLAHLAAREPL